MKKLLIGYFILITAFGTFATTSCSTKNKEFENLLCYLTVMIGDCNYSSKQWELILDSLIIIAPTPKLKQETIELKEEIHKSYDKLCREKIHNIKSRQHLYKHAVKSLITD